MKTSTLKTYILLCIALNQIACLKYDNSTTSGKPKSPTCNDFKDLRIKTVLPIECGNDIVITADSFPEAKYDWKGSNLSATNIGNSIHVTDNANLYHRGWYYVTIKYGNCTSIKDSVLVNVKLKQGTPNCNPTNNIATYSSGVTIPAKNFYRVSSDTFNDYTISASSLNVGDLTLRFCDYWRRNKLETGIYYTVNDISSIDKDCINKVNLVDANFNQNWISEEKKPIYISYVNGKLTITICDLLIYDPTFGGTTLNSKINARLTLQ